MNTAMVSLLAPVASLSLVVTSPTMAATPAGVVRNDVHAAAPVLPLQPLSMAMVMKAGAAGSGCSWSLAKDRRMRFAAADDRAVIRLADDIVRLRPAAGAGDLFPFTYDRWTGDGVTLTVKPVGPSTWKGTEVNEGAAYIDVHIGGHRWAARGRLNCGS
ncbi:hypothetical protein V3I01_06240 [Sphingomonas sp. gentR]|jgi:hypothetical protein|uniref:hypothetical protein n=1 Tax=unclassified Sphingomonas TaxID=196159 RepID=UPI000972C4A9|nr:hypothetical protein [Sphingomonas sp. LK11]APX65989.1 hypothetical protein AV944_09240 [Sphingomonas sp. LK11]